MAVVNGTIADITADTLLSQSKPKLKANDDDLLENDIAIESRVTTAEGNITTLTSGKAPIANPTFTGTVTTPKAVITPEGGIAISLLNKTGVASVKGSVVSCASSTDNAFILQTDEFSAVGVVYQNGIADGSACLVVISGIADVLLKNTTASTRGYWVKCADTDGRADATTALPTGGSFAGVDDHFKEIGHCLETKAGGTDVLAKIVLHMN